MKLPGAVGMMTSLVACALLATGCTMCPDPFDYSGPVPNGSAPQNDFMARSNGILPLRSRPLPWPPVVDADAAPDAGATVGAEGTESDEQVAAGTADDTDSVTR
jgi:hypothetical protein